jgi:hypothetical protein
VKRFIDAVIAFFGLYFTSLFAFDAYHAAEQSMWNVHSVPPAGGPGAWVRGGQKVGAGAAKQGSGTAAAGRRVGTLNDLKETD